MLPTDAIRYYFWLLKSAFSWGEYQEALKMKRKYKVNLFKAWWVLYGHR